MHRENARRRRSRARARERDDGGSYRNPRCGRVSCRRSHIHRRYLRTVIVDYTLRHRPFIDHPEQYKEEEKKRMKEGQGSGQRAPPRV